MDTGTAVSTDTLAGTAIVEILGQLKLAVAQLRLYPKESPQVAKSGAAAYQALSSWLDQHENLALAGTAQGLRVNGVRFPARDFAMLTLESSFVSLLLDAGVKSIVCRKGLSLEELLTFLNALTHKFWDMKEGKEINRRLRDEQVRSVSVDEIEYVAVGEGDLLIKDAGRTLEESGSRVADLMKTLERLTEEVVDPRLGADGRLAIMKKLIEQDPTLLEKAGGAGTRGGPERSAGILPLETAREAVGEVARLLHDAPQGLHPALRRIGGTIIEAFRHDPRLAALMRQFLSEEAVDLLPVWMTETMIVQTQEAGPVARAKTLLALDGESAADPLLQEAGPLVRELIPLGRPDLAAKLLARLNGFLVDRSAERRRSAGETLLSLQPVWQSAPFSAMREGFEGLIRSALDSEQDAQAYGRLAELATLLADARLRQGELDRALETLQLLRRHHTHRDAALGFRPESAYRALEKIVLAPGFPGVVDRIRTGDPIALRVAEALGEAAARFLVEAMKKIETTAERLPVAEAISRIGSSAAAVLSEELQRTTSPTEALRLIDVLPHAVPESVAAVALGSTLRHPELAVRRRTASVLVERGFARSGELLLQALPDEKDPSIRVTMIEGLGKLRMTGAFESLATLAAARGEADAVRAAACMALGRLGHAEVIPILADLCSKGSGLGALLKSNSPEVRSAAIKALGFFPAVPAAREALKRATEGSDPGLQAVAREVLFRPIEKAPGEKAPVTTRRERPTPTPKPSNVKLAGSLQEIPIDQVCQLVGGSAKTGLLMLSVEGRVARIYFEQGLVVAADFEGLQDQQAFNALVALKKGEFIFQSAEVAAKRIRLPVQSLLLEAFRVTDEQGRKAAPATPARPPAPAPSRARLRTRPAPAPGPESPGRSNQTP